MDTIDRKDLEVFSYLLRVLLSRIVEQAIRYRCKSESHLSELAEPISVEEYFEAVDTVNAQISAKIKERELDLHAF